MRTTTPILLASFLVLALSGSAFGQTEPTPSPSPLPERRYLTAAGGISFESDGDPTFGIEYGERVHRYAQAYTVLSYFDDLFPRTSREDLEQLGRALSTLKGETWEFHGRDRGIAVTAGGRLTVPARSSVQLYLGAGAGGINLKRTITERTLGNVTNLALGTVGADGIVDLTETSTLKPMAEGVAGLALAAGRTYIDVGYRFRRIFHTPGPFEFSQVSVGVGMRWF